MSTTFALRIALCFALLTATVAPSTAAKLNVDAPPAGYDRIAADVTDAVMREFWNRTGGNIFSNALPSAETVGSDAAHNNGYVLWPSIIAFQALVEGERAHPGRYAARIWTVYNAGWSQYWNPQWHCYMAWRMFPGNTDSYYDDNAWAVIALVEAYTATKTSDPDHASTYLTRAAEIMKDYESAGWDNTGKPGGVKWGTDATKSGTTDKTASASAGAALAALMLARSGRNVKFNTNWGNRVLTWINGNLADTDHLVRDGYRRGGDSKWSIMPTKWTYNTGVTIRAYAQHYQLTHDARDLRIADAMAHAAIDHHSALFDGLVVDPDKRCWYDGVYFEHYLIDGLIKLGKVTKDKKLKTAITAECRREANYTYNYIRDPADSLYWRNLRLWRIGPSQDAVWQQLTGQAQALDQDTSEMSGSQYVKTLLANASAARMFWLMTEL